MLKDKLDDFITDALGKLDTGTVLILLPCAILLYVCIFVPNEDIEHIFGLGSTKNEFSTEECIQITCPHCSRTFIYYFDNPIDSTLHK